MAITDILDRVRSAKDRITSRRDESSEAVLGDGCGFSQHEIDAAPSVEVTDLEEGE